MSIYFNALIVCDRCDAELHMDDVSTESEVEQRLRNSESKWADDENGDQVCGACWAKWDSARASDARLTDSESGKATGSATQSSTSVPSGRSPR